MPVISIIDFDITLLKIKDNNLNQDMKQNM